MLIATDTAERDIDIGDIYHVVNYDPHKETEGYVHHIGRTGCMGAKGTAHSFYAADEHNLLLRGAERLARRKIEGVEHQYP
jgi:superfamily II DNA/RNA helicase